MSEQQSSQYSSAFNPAKGEWQIEWPGRVSRHDLVYLSPPEDPMQGLALGNGDIGVLCWCEGSKIILAVNKCDLWDDAPGQRFHNWAADEEERSTTLRHACRIIVDFGLPVFDRFYLSDFQGRLSLADALASINASGPLGQVDFQAFVSHDDWTMCIELKANLSEDVPVVVSIERFGSRTFSHWYKLVNRDPSIGLAGTDSLVDTDAVYITHKLTSGQFAAGCRVVSANNCDVSTAREHSHRSHITFSGSGEKTIKLTAEVTSPLETDPIPALRNKLQAACSQGISSLYTLHADAWKAVWQRSFMEFGDDYLDNLWHLTMYYAYASQRGAYPGRFIGGLWGWNRDVQPWNFFFHWNQQEIYWPLNAAGHNDLIDSYLEYRFNALEHGRSDAREFLGMEGAVVSDVCDRHGRNSSCEFTNRTPVAQIALEFWRQYQFTGDLDFLTTRALPYMLEAARFAACWFQLESDGLYHTTGEPTSFEGWTKFRDPASELSCASALFQAVLKALNTADVDDKDAAKWRDILEKMAPLPVVPAPDDLIDQSCLQWGLFEGDKVDSNLIMSAGFGLEEQRYLTSQIPTDNNLPWHTTLEQIQSFESGKEVKPVVEKQLGIYDGICPGSEFAPVFPTGLIDTRHMGTDSYKAMSNTARLYSPECMGWESLPIVFARLGLSEELDAILTNWPAHWQYYVNGWGHYGSSNQMKPEVSLPFHVAIVQDAEEAAISGFNWSNEHGVEEFPFPTWPFRHMDMESMPVLACAMNESLLQSHDGTILLAPAAGSRNSRFTLHAAGGFIVSSELINGEPCWVAIHSHLGRTCKIVNPWSKAWIDDIEFSDTMIEFSTRPGETYILTPVKDKNWNVQAEAYAANQTPKTHSTERTMLGLPRMF